MSTHAQPRIGAAAGHADAEQVALDAALAARVTVRTLATPVMVQAAADLFCAVWRTPLDKPPLPANVIRAIEHSGGYAAGAYDERGELVSASVGFLGDTAGSTHLHSHITGVAASARGRGLGRAIKLHQRAWSLRRGIACISWTFDPLVRRNAAFNINTLGAFPTDYLVDFYGQMTDGINTGDASDRLYAQWALHGSAPEAPVTAVTALLRCDASSRPVFQPANGALVAVALPADIEALRRSDPDAAREWRLAVRETLGAALIDGAQVVGFNAEAGYLLRRPQG